MKNNLFAIFVIVFLFPINSDAFDKWTKGQKILQGIYLTEVIIDYAQTRYIIDDNNYYEKNRILGKHPTLKEVNMFFIVKTIAHTGITHILPSRYRRYWFTMTIVSQSIAIVNNYSIGVKMKF